MTWDFQTPVQVATTTDGFVTEVAGKVILTAPGTMFSAVDELPADIAATWAGKVHQHPYSAWVQGRYVEGEHANRNGALWSAGDLEMGVATVQHGPFNWLHQKAKVIGSIVDAQLVTPKPPVLMNKSFEQLLNPPEVISKLRPYIAALSVAWRWVHPDEVAVLQMASEMGQLYYSMECIAEQIQCVEDATTGGCGKSFDYFEAMTDQSKVCEHIRAKSSTRRMVNPTFLGGAAVVPPARPGWGEANAKVMQQAASMAEKTAGAQQQLSDEQWETLMASVLAYAATC